MASTALERQDDQGRATAHWWPLHWTSPLVVEPPRPISIFDLCELRAVVDTDRVAAGLDPVAWVGRTDDDPTFVAGVTPIRAVHFTQLRAAIADLWELADLGPLPPFRAGPIVPGTRPISIRDPLDLRTWIETYEDERPDLAARVAWRYGAAPRLGPWPELADGIPPDSSVEIWDGVGHAHVLTYPDLGHHTEVRRIDTHWYRTDLSQSSESVRASITPDPRAASASPPLSWTLPPNAVGEIAGARFLTWEPKLPALDPTWQIERDGLGQIVRILDRDVVVRRLAYDGLGRLRKWVDRATWHVLGPDLARPVAGGAPPGAAAPAREGEAT